jgi:hypothetical protein
MRDLKAHQMANRGYGEESIKLLELGAGIRQAFDRQYSLVTHRMGEDRTRIMRHIVKQNRTGAAFQVQPRRYAIR